MLCPVASPKHLVAWLAVFLCTGLVAASNQAWNESTQIRTKRSSVEDCCPSVEEITEPVGGVNRQGRYVGLYRYNGNAQRFIEYSCSPGVVDKPCRFIDSALQAQSRCVQKYSYSYALVANADGSSSWTLDYIRVHSGCGCQVTR